MSSTSVHRAKLIALLDKTAGDRVQIAAEFAKILDEAVLRNGNESSSTSVAVTSCSLLCDLLMYNSSSPGEGSESAQSSVAAAHISARLVKVLLETGVTVVRRMMQQGTTTNSTSRSSTGPVLQPLTKLFLTAAGTTSRTGGKNLKSPTTVFDFLKTIAEGNPKYQRHSTAKMEIYRQIEMSEPGLLTHHGRDSEGRTVVCYETDPKTVDFLLTSYCAHSSFSTLPITLHHLPSPLHTLQIRLTRR